MTFKAQYGFGNTVYLITDEDQYPRLVVGLIFRPGSEVLYEVICGTEASQHYEFELCDKPDMLTKTR